MGDKVIINYENARTEINKLSGKEAPDNIEQVRKQYNLYVLNDTDINNLIWYLDLSHVYMNKKDLFEDTKKELATDGYKLTAEIFKKIDKEVDLSRFDYPSAFHIVCKNVRNGNFIKH